jgi:hypothetical protein
MNKVVVICFSAVSSKRSGDESDEGQASAGNDNIGGLVGYMYDGSISKSFASGNVKGTTKVGGLIGRVDKGTVEQVYSRGNVSSVKFNNTGGFYTGGLIGFIDGSPNIKEAYSSGAVSASSYVGGFIGQYYSSGIVSDCYFDITASGQSKGIGVIEVGSPIVFGKNTQEMKQQNTYNSWNFNTVWDINSQTNDGYPYLRDSESGVIGGDNGNGSDVHVYDIKKSDKKHGVLLDKSIVSDKADMRIILANNEKVLQVKVAIYDNVGNVVFEKTQSKADLSWNLTNTAGRRVANGTYLVVAEVKGVSGKTYAYSTKLGVKR